MTNELATIVIGGIIFANRLWSAWEHKSTKKDVTEIKIMFNGEMDKKLEQAREEGRQEERKKKDDK